MGRSCVEVPDGAILPDLLAEDPDMVAACCDLSQTDMASTDIAEQPDAAMPPDMTVLPPDMVFVPIPSCVGLAATCGVNSNDSCCNSLLVPTGSYHRSYDVASDLYNDLTYPATVSSLRVDRYEVTVGRFRKFLSAGMGVQTSPPSAGAGGRTLNGAAAQGGWDPNWNAQLPPTTDDLKTGLNCSQGTWTDTAGANETKPISCVTWYEAFAFCVWDGGFMPTEAEWNYVATGGAEQRAYPWSNPADSTTVDSTYAVYMGAGAAANVGSKSPKGDGRWGHADLAGNVSEWMLDWYADPYPTTSCSDCANLTSASNRVHRGMGFTGFSSTLRTAARWNIVSNNRGYALGVRCARTP